MASEVLTGAASGAGTGALLGSAVGMPFLGAGAGALVGGGLGWLTGSSREDAKRAQQKALEEAMKRLQAMSMRDYAQRQQNLQKATALYGPAQQMLQERLSSGAPYIPGPPGAAPPPGWQGLPPPPGTTAGWQGVPPTDPFKYMPR